MTVDIMELMSLKPKLKKFFADHPKVKPFIGAASRKMTPGSVVEIKVTPADGGEGIRMNIKLNPDDIATLKKVKDLL